MPYVNNGGIRIHYEVEGEGHPLVLQHGFMQNVKHWRAAGYVDALKSTYQLILIDARGHGASDKPHVPAAYALSSRVSDVVGVLDALHIETAHFWGYSMGGWIGFGMAKYAAQRLDALIIGGSDPYERRSPPPGRVDVTAPEAFVDSLLARLQVDPTAIPSAMREEILANDFQALAAAQQDRSSLEDVLPTMTMRCLLYAGDADPVYPKTRACAQRISTATFVSLVRLDHVAAFREAGLVLPHVAIFLRQVSEDVPAG